MPHSSVLGRGKIDVYVTNLTTLNPISFMWTGVEVARFHLDHVRGIDKATGKFASAHDLRRSFGTRWAPRVKPATLQLLMRHRSIETTLKYYVDQDADDVADELWRTHRALGNTPTTASQESEKGSSDQSTKPFVS